MTTTIIGFPRIGEQRELKYTTEKYFRHEMNAEELEAFGKSLRQKHWNLIKDSGVDTIPSNDFSFYDTTLDTAFLLNLVPKDLATIELSDLDKYFALARGYQGEKGDIKARPMKKWFNTNYHYIVPKIELNTDIQLVGTKIFDEYVEAKELGIETRPVILGPYSLLHLSELDEGVNRQAVIEAFVVAYKAVFTRLTTLGAEWIQLDEPALVKDLTSDEIAEFEGIYQSLLADETIKVLLQTYFGDVRDIYETLIALPFAGIGLDFIEGIQNKAFVQKGFPKDKILVAGVVNGKNIWRNNYQKTLDLLTELDVENVVLSTSCSLLHVPFTTENETFPAEIKEHFSFAKEKLTELLELSAILAGNGQNELTANQALFTKERFVKNKALSQKIANLTEQDFTRTPAFVEREVLQKAQFNLPVLPTTTIGSFPQTKEVKQTRAKFTRQEITQEAYDNYIAAQIDDWLAWQTSIDLDVLVHGEFERNDMVEYFGQNLSGYLFSQNGWVQSYGTRGVKPPIIWGDVVREQAITVKWSKYAQSQTDKIVKGMLTGPVTILNWSF
nr:5-methyltetrahydropteroyltriglutamate--homocysteine S-methyltransferase [Enterococcus sp.]